MDPNRLLEGEDPSTPHPEEARHWVDVYSELLTFKEKTISSAQRNADQMSMSEAREEVEETDLTALEAELDRLRKRLNFWERRCRELRNE